jgi:DNA replication protein DnaC
VFPSHAEDRDVKEAIQTILRDCTPEQGDAAKPQCIVTVSELSEKEYRSLNEATEEKLKNKGWFSLAVPEEEPKRSQPAKQRVLDEEGRQKSRPVPVPPQKKERQDGAKGLAEVARDLEAMRETLLKKVRGQRHAVYELTQGMFESELFSRYDTARKGPVSTFLFMGPSGVGKTFLAKCFGELSDRPVLVVDMSEYSDNLANLKFNGDHGQSAVVTGFVRKNPNAILIFDEIEKAHINTIHLFLQILDAGQLMDQQLNKEVSFRDTTIIMTTNVGSELYDNVESRNLSNIPRSALINALNSEKKKGYGEEETVFPQSITTRMANGHIIMFNHLEPYALLEIVRDELALQIDLFRQATGITVEFDEVNLPALIMYAGGGAADARTLRGLARNTVIKEIQDAVMQANETPDRDLTALKKLYLTVSIPDDAEDIYKLFHQTQGMQAVVLSADAAELETVNAPYLNFHITDDAATFQKRLRGVTDFVLLDPYTGYVIGDRMPADVEDIRSPGMEMFEYLLEYYPEIPIYILDTGKHGQINFGTLLSRGARGVLTLGGELQELTDLLHEYSLNALIGNSVYQLGRAGKYLSYNCAQYPMDEQSVEICFAGLRLKTAVNGEDYGSVTQKGENSSVTFDDIVGCDSAKEALKEFCAVLDDPRKGLLSGKRMPKGVLLYGPPGTGKTMLAKAMANHSNAMFLPISATAFFGSLVG